MTVCGLKLFSPVTSIESIKYFCLFCSCKVCATAPEVAINNKKIVNVKNRI